MTKRLQYFLCVGIFILAFFVYSSTFSSTLFFNEITNFYEAGLGSPRALLGDSARWIFYVWNYLTVSAAGLSVEVFRVQNFIVHLLISMLFFLLFNFLFDQLLHDSWLFKARKKIVLLGTGLFLLHPVQTQTVLNVLQMRLEGLMALMVMVILLLMMYAIVDEKPWWKNEKFWAASIIAVGSVGTKESIIILPILVMALDWFFIAQGSFMVMLRRAGMYAVFCVAFLTSFFIINNQLSLVDIFSGKLTALSVPGCLITSSHQVALSVYSYVMTQIPLFFHYLWIFFNPLGLSFDYDVMVCDQFLHPLVFASFLGIFLTAFVALAAWYVEKTNLFSFAMTWFFIALLPRMTFVSSSELIGDYKTFLASIGMMIFLSGLFWWILDFLCEKVFFIESRFGWGVIASIVLWGLFWLLGVTKSYGDLSMNPVLFWERVRSYAPNKARTFYNLGAALQDQGRLSDAIDCYQQALLLDSEYADPLIALGEMYQKNGDMQRALSYYARAEKKRHLSSARLYLNQGDIYVSQGDLGAAENAFKQVLELQPARQEAIFKYAQLLKTTKRFSQAYEYIDKYLQLAVKEGPREAYLLKAHLAFELGHYKEVIGLLEKRLAAEDDISLSFMLAASYYASENYKKSAEFFEKVYQACPDNLDVAYNCGQAFMHCDKYAMAIPYFKQCAENEKYPFAPVHIATCLFKNGNQNSAQQLFASLDKDDISVPVKLQLAQLKHDFHLA